MQAIIAGADDLQDVDLTLPGRPSLVVLPLQAADETPAGALLAEGLTNDIITQVARARWLFVVARGTALRFRRGPYDPRDVGQALGVRYPLYAEALRAGRGMLQAAVYATRAARQPNAHYHVIAIAAFCNMLAGNAESAKHHYSRLKSIRPDYTADAYLTAFRHKRERNARLVRRTFQALNSLV